MKEDGPLLDGGGSAKSVIMPEEFMIGETPTPQHRWTVRGVVKFEAIEKLLQVRAAALRKLQLPDQLLSR
jgi:hypothetical protein